MPYNCCYGTCKSSSKKGSPQYDENVRFYRFPQPCLLLRDNVLNWSNNTEKNHVKTCSKCQITEIWMKKIKRKRFQRVRQITTNTMICSKHFVDPPAVMDYEKYVPSGKTPSSAQIRSRQRYQLLQEKRSQPISTASQRAIEPSPPTEQKLVVLNYWEE
uniref:Homeobox-leucine zipper protein HDG11 n=1 Tax=Lygus hesperus TaxID=30085 RepID=A0A0A9YDF8_LYGHE